MRSSGSFLNGVFFFFFLFRPRGQNVLPLVNKANCVLRWRQDFPGCEDLIKKAIEIDPECDVAVVTLAQISLQSSKIHQAQEMFKKAMDIARSEEELVQAVCFFFFLVPPSVSWADDAWGVQSS